MISLDRGLSVRGLTVGSALCSTCQWIGYPLLAEVVAVKGPRRLALPRFRAE
jgi:hypothetical protein